ncbi:YncE family protein [Fodinibius saliphilus]|uniref:YncE family protein n=1 Tax=Fodinibius saliphilus TaxID=1920650 RepID=UPI001109CEA1|nr:DUF5074 domain-containing protein [Fodinibius saliphilus]
MKKRYSLFLLSLVILIVSCDKDNDNNPAPLEDSAAYVVNEGNFSDANGSITSYSPESGSTILQAFDKENGRPLAGYLQTSKKVDERIYIVSNKADKIEIIDYKTLESKGTIDSFEKAPTAIEIVDGVAFVGTADFKGATDSLRMFDLASFEKKEAAIEVGNTPRDIERVGDNLYVSNNGFGYGNTVSVIDLSSNEVIETITVGAGPNELIVDNEERVWVVCNGRKSYSEGSSDVPGSVYIIDGNSATVIDSITEGITLGAQSYQERLVLNSEKAEAYLLNNGISVIDMNSYTIKKNIVNESFYAIGYFPLQQSIYVGKSNGTSQPGKGYVYDLEGAPVDSFNVGIIPHKFHFTSN